MIYLLTLVFSGHKDSVIAVDFSHDSKYLCTGDMSGLIKVWSLTELNEVWSFEVSELEVRKPLYSLETCATISSVLWIWVT